MILLILKGKGLALATSLAAMIQTGLSLWLIREKVGKIDLKRLLRTTVRVCLATAVMSALILLELQFIPAVDRFLFRLIRVLVPVISAVLVYLLLAKLLGLYEILTLMRSGSKTAEDE